VMAAGMGEQSVWSRRPPMVEATVEEALGV
jgi:hypothetical protein